MSLELIKKKFKSYSPDGNWSIIEKAYHFALKVHAGQKRVSGEVYIIHPLGVAQIIADLELDPVTIAAGILHDVVEDTGTTLEDLREIFGEEISLLVDGVTKLSKLQFTSKEEHQAENLRKMFVAMARDIRVILIKLADRLHNMRTLKYLHPTKRKEIATETLEIYAPLAHRLGIYKLKWELEDLAFRFLEPEKYYNLVDKLVTKRQDREEFISKVISKLQERLEEVGIEADIQGRPKHLYGIYEKMERQGKDINEIYDLTGIRLVVENVKDCYGALGIVHTLWRPIPGRFKDHIAMPKANMYQSLHTTVVCAKNELLEVQIRTWEMHRTSEYGIAAHWRYKEGVKGDAEFEEKLSWLRQLLEWQQDLKDAHEFMENLKIDLFTDEVFVFTPKGDVINLPAGAISLDFAYRIHTDIGHRCVGAKVNGRLVPLEYTLSTGDIVEIVTSKQGNPSRDWLKMVKSSQAKSKIRSWFKKEKKEENIVRGKEILEKELKKIDLSPKELLKPAILTEIGKRFNLLSEEDVYSAVGYGGVTPQQIITRLREEHKKMHKDEAPLEEPKLKPWKDKEKAGKGIRIEGMDNLLIRFARCCNPLPGDKIVGFITRGRGVSIHRRDCPNLANREDSWDRALNASWEEDPKVSYPVEIEITAMDRTNLLQELVAAVSESKINITAVNGRTNKNQVATIHLTIVVRDLEHLQHTMNRLRKVKDVFSVDRFFSS